MKHFARKIHVKSDDLSKELVEFKLNGNTIVACLWVSFMEKIRIIQKACHPFRTFNRKQLFFFKNHQYSINFKIRGTWNSIGGIFEGKHLSHYLCKGIHWQPTYAFYVFDFCNYWYGNFASLASVFSLPLTGLFLFLAFTYVYYEIRFCTVIIRLNWFKCLQSQ